MPLRRFTTAELVLTQRTYLERPLLVLVLLGSASFALAEGSMFYLALTALGVGINAAAIHRRSEVYVPRLVVNLAVLLASVFFAVDFFRAEEVLYALGHYLILIQVCKLFEQKRNRDYIQILALSLVLIVAGAMATAALWFAVLLAVYVPVACYVAMVLTLKVALDRQASSRLPAEAAPLDPRQLAWNVSSVFPRRQLWLSAARSTAVCTVSAVLVFVLMPRGSPGGIMPFPPGRSDGETGWSDVMRLTELGKITQDRRVVMRATIDRDGRDLGKAGERVYLRGKCYDDYQGGTWRASRPSSEWWPMSLSRASTRPGPGMIRQTITMEPSLLPTLFAVSPGVWYDLPAHANQVTVYPDAMAESLGSEGLFEYVVYSWPSPLTPKQREALQSEAIHRPRPRTPEEFPVPSRVADLARQWCADLLEQRQALPKNDDPDDPAVERLNLAMAQRICTKLQAEYGYTLDIRIADAAIDPVEDFLFNTRRGHCEFFASAMALMCRAVDVPCRVCGGFLADEYSDAGGGYMVRAADAHAWCEVFTAETDWQIFDPTPPGALQSAGAGLAAVRRAWDALGFYWRTRVIGYGENDRMGVFGGIVRRFDEVWQAVARWGVRTGRAIWRMIRYGLPGARWEDLLQAGVALAGVVALPTSLVLLIRRRRRRARGTVRPTDPPRFYRRLLKVLSARGCRQQPCQTAREFLLESAETLALPPATLVRLAEIIYRLRWARQNLDQPDQVWADQAVGEMARRTKRRNIAPTGDP